MGQTLDELIALYRSDPDSSYRTITYEVRLRHERLLARIGRERGSYQLRDIRARTLVNWHKGWMSGGKVAMAAALVGQLRVLFRFGASLLENEDCQRLVDALSGLQLKRPRARNAEITGEQVRTVCKAAHDCGYHSIALAQAFQFELRLGQKEVIGEWVPLTEPGDSGIIWRGKKWRRGLRWDEIDDQLVFRRVLADGSTVQADLNAPGFLRGELYSFPWFQGRPLKGPVVVYEGSAMPWLPAEFRRKWRMMATLAGLPADVRNNDCPRRP